MHVEYVVHLSCNCQCHWDRTLPLATYHGIDITRDVEVTGGVETVTACASCIDAHCPALLLTRLANDPAPERRERFEWTDPKPEPGGDDGN